LRFGLIASLRRSVSRQPAEQRHHALLEVQRDHPQQPDRGPDGPGKLSETQQTALLVRRL